VRVGARIGETADAIPVITWTCLIAGQARSHAFDA